LAGITIDAEPLASVVAADVYVPLLSVTVPVGVGLPLPPLTVTVTVIGCALVKPAAGTVTVTVGVIFPGGGVTEFPPPPPHDAIHKLATILSQRPA
jgi:hypothetical protein